MFVHLGLAAARERADTRTTARVALLLAAARVAVIQSVM